MKVNLGKMPIFHIEGYGLIITFGNSIINKMNLLPVTQD